MTQMDINFCILLFYIFLRNVMAFLKELAILYRFFNLRISNKTTLLEISPNGAQNIFFLFKFLFNFISKCIHIVQKNQMLRFKSM